MCYLCRKALGPPLTPSGNRRRLRYQENLNPFGNGPALEQDDDDEEEEEHEGYRHFCEHFRVNPGARCTACNKCELYQDEDEEAVARHAGEKAECEWRIRHQMAGGTDGGAGAGARIPAVNVNRDLSMRTGRADRRYSTMIMGPRGKSFWYWVDEMWRTGRWKTEGQALVDWIVERVIFIQEL